MSSTPAALSCSIWRSTSTSPRTRSRPFGRSYDIGAKRVDIPAASITALSTAYGLSDAMPAGVRRLPSTRPIEAHSRYAAFTVASPSPDASETSRCVAPGLSERALTTWNWLKVRSIPIPLSCSDSNYTS